jgi:tRNA-uridine 2-sulfurtransferase
MKADGLAGRRVLVAMSGGVDSSVAAAMLAEQGAEVVGATYKNFCFTDSDALPGRSCCSVDAVADALAVCRHLGIEHRVVDETARFQAEVVDDFEREYAAGRTPNPCVRCNAAVRFPRLVEEADAAGFDFVATGHYARLLRDGDRHFLAAGVDGSKDQSYFLAAVDPALHSRLLFPLGELTKPETRELARKAGLHLSEKRESQDVCFLAGGTLRDYLGERGLLEPGPIIDGKGELLGEHPGAALFTLGQRHGLGVSASRPLYVTDVDAVTNTVTLGDESDLGVTRLRSRGAWVHEALLDGSLSGEIAAKIRYRSPALPVADWSFTQGALAVSFAEPVKAPAPGQSLVLYHGDHVVGHGILS